MQDTLAPEQTIPHTPAEAQNQDISRQEQQTIWGTLEYVKWDEAKQVWKRMKKECTKKHAIQKNLIKHWARVRQEQWRQLSRYAILRPYCGKNIQA